MPCHEVRTPRGGHGFVCTGRERRRRCVECGRPVAYLCDWKLAGSKKGKTCSRGLCERCAASPGPGKHLCPAHARRWATHPKNPHRVEAAS